MACMIHWARSGINCFRSAIPAYAPKVLRNYGSEQLSERFNHPVVSFDVRIALEHAGLSCGTLTYGVIEA